MSETRSPVDVPTWFVEPTFAGRFLAVVTDGLVFTVLGFLAAVLTGSGSQARWYVTALVAIYTIGAVALSGRTLGKLVFGLRVADLATGGLPTVGAATRRWLVPVAPTTLAALLPSTGILAAPRLALSVAPLVIYWGVLSGPLHRGLHDRAAGTVVTVGRQRPAEA